MNPAVASKGESFKGVIQYITHDPNASTAERVEWVETLNMRTSDPEKAAKVMAWTAEHAAMLKESNGAKKTGQKTKAPVYHYSLNFSAEENINSKEMAEAAKQSLKVLGYQDHEAVLAIHRDKDHPHIHIVVNRINPVTGMTANPYNERNALQKWAYQFEKERGKVVCLERAIKYEKAPHLRAEYQKRLTAEQQQGPARESKPRPQWEAEKGAAYPKSARFKELKADFGDKSAALAKQGRDAFARRQGERAALKTRQASERASFLARQRITHKTRGDFRAASTHRPRRYTWERYQTERAGRLDQQREQFEAMRARVAEKNAPTIQKFKEQQRAAWATFNKVQAAASRGTLDKALRLVANTSVRHHSKDFNGHLAAVFRQNSSPQAQKEGFAAQMEKDRRAFYDGLYQQNSPEFAKLAEAQRSDLLALRSRFEQSREGEKQHTAATCAQRASDQQQKADFSRQQRAERDALRQQQAREIRAEREQRESLNRERREAWQRYREDTAKQVAKNEAGRRQEAANAKDNARASDYQAERRTVGRDYAEPSSDKTRDTGGRTRGPQ